MEYLHPPGAARPARGLDRVDVLPTRPDHHRPVIATAFLENEKQRCARRGNATKGRENERAAAHSRPRLDSEARGGLANCDGVEQRCDCNNFVNERKAEKTSNRVCGTETSKRQRK